MSETVTSVTPNQLTMSQSPANPTKIVNQTTDQNVHNVQSLHKKLDTFELITGNQNERRPTPGGIKETMHAMGTTQDGINDFIAVEEGAKHAVRTKNIISNKSITGDEDSKSKNLFAILQTSEDNNEGSDDHHTDHSPELLAGKPKRDVLEKLRSIATTLTLPISKPTQVVKQKLKKQAPPLIPSNFSNTDKKYLNHPNGFDLIEQKLTLNKHDDLLLNDLAWYITTAKPHIGHVQGQI